MRSVYYWRTSLTTDSAQQAFIGRHRIGRMYTRFFDVVMDGQGRGALPNATLRFSGSVPSGVEVVPVVYIVNDCMVQPDTALPRKLLRRVVQMCETHGLERPRELQIDCDWTRRTRTAYFAFLDTLRRQAAAEGIQLSATIRLHQLAQPVPPVDRGVLMVYNTGDATRIDVEKPILDLRDVQPYLSRLAGYGLPLAAAYPVFRWQLLFRGGRFVDFLNGSDDPPILPTDTIVTRQPQLADILAVKQAVDAARRQPFNEIIIYDLNPFSIQRFTDNDYEAIFCP